MTLIFTNFLRSLEPTGEPGATTDFPALWRALRGALRRELRRRGLWESSPRLLGLTGTDAWGLGSRSTPLEAWFPGDALDELATETYLKVFVARLHSLRHHLESKPNVEGLVFRAIRQVVHDVQKRHDPLGYRIFKFTRSAVRSLLDREQIHLVSGGPRIINGTVFGFDPEGGTEGEEARPRIEASITRWNNELFPEMLIVRGEERLRRVLEFGERILELQEEGVRTFAFQDLVHPMKADVRERWTALWRTTGSWEYLGDQDGDPVCWVEPDNAVEERDRFDKLTRCIRRRLGTIGGQKRTQGHRQRLWDFLEVFASNSIAGSEVLEALDLEELPSQRELGRLLAIPRQQFGGLFQDLENAVRTCQRELASSGASSGPARPRRPPVEPGGGERVRAELLGLTAAQWSASATPPTLGARRRPSPRRGRSPSFDSWRRDWRAKTAMAVALAAAVALWFARPENQPVQGGALPHLYLLADRVTRGLPDHRVLELSMEETRSVLVVPVPVAPRPAHFELRKLQAPRDQPPLWRSPVADRGGGEEALILDLADFEGTFRLELIDSERTEVVSTYTFEIRRRPTAAYRRPWEWGGGSAS